LHCLCGQVVRQTMALASFFSQQMWHVNLLVRLFRLVVVAVEDILVAFDLVVESSLPTISERYPKSKCSILFFCRAQARLAQFEWIRHCNHDSLLLAFHAPLAQFAWNDVLQPRLVTLVFVCALTPTFSAALLETSMNHNSSVIVFQSYSLVSSNLAIFVAKIDR